MLELSAMIVIGSIVVAIVLLFTLSKYGPGPSMISAGVALLLPQIPGLALPYLDKMLEYSVQNGMTKNWTDELAAAPPWVEPTMMWMLWVTVALVVVGIAGQTRRNLKLSRHLRGRGMNRLS